MPPDAISQDETTQERLQQTIQDVALGLKVALDRSPRTISDQNYAELVGKLSVLYFTENTNNTSILSRVISLIINKKGEGMSGKELELKDFLDNSLDENNNKPHALQFNVSDGGSIQIEQFILQQHVHKTENKND